MQQKDARQRGLRRFASKLDPRLRGGTLTCSNLTYPDEVRGDERRMTDKKKPPAPIPLCRFEELAERENRLRDEAARKAAKSTRKPR